MVLLPLIVLLAKIGELAKVAPRTDPWGWQRQLGRSRGCTLAAAPSDAVPLGNLRSRQLARIRREHLEET